jgi:uncharacterized protein (DUF58 family)
MLVPTKRFWVLAAMGIPVAALGAILPGFEWLLIPYNVLIFSLLLIGHRIAKKWDFIQVKRVVDPILSVRTPNVVRLEVTNESDQPIRVTLRDEPPAAATSTKHEFNLLLQPGKVQEVTYTVTPLERGPEEFHGTFLRHRDPFGLSELFTKLDNQQDVRVYPNVLAIREFEMLKQRGRLDLMGVRRSRIKGLGQEFESLRDYNEDDYRTIDWKASARRGRLVVKNFEQERNQGLVVCIDCGRHMMGTVKGVRKLDYALDSGLMLMHAAERAGDQIGLLVFNDLVHRWIAPKKGRAQVAAILDAIHALEPEPVESDPLRAFAHLASRWKRRSLVVVFTDAEEGDQAGALAAGLASIRRRHLVMVVRVSDPRLREIKSMAVTDERSLYLKAAGRIYDQERSEAGRILALAGIDSLESEPEELSARLVSAYLRVKEMNLL